MEQDKVLLIFQPLGTAAGDLISEGLGLGYLFGTILFAALIGIIAIARFAFKANVVLFLFAKKANCRMRPCRLPIR